VYESGEWEVDLARRELRARSSLPDRGRSFEIIEVLVQSPGRLAPLTSTTWLWARAA
jgi:hypothetical protein